MSGTTQATQWLRACSLIIADMQGNGIELSGPDLDQVLRIRFNVSYHLNSTPCLLRARVYNLQQDTINKLVSYASKNPPTIDGFAFATGAQVILKAGYQQNFGQLFKGQVYQYRQGYENSTDSFLDIFAADGGFMHSHDVMNTYFAKGYTAVDVWTAFNDSAKKWNIAKGDPPNGLDTSRSPRGKVVFGMTRDRLDDLARTYNFRWNVVDGQMQGLPNFTFKPNQEVVVNHLTGQIGFPEQTEEGVKVTVLMNPAMTWGTKVRLNNLEVTRLLISGSNRGPSDPQPGGLVQNANQYVVSGTPTNPNWVPPMAPGTDGDYVVLAAEHIGDTRGNEWYSKCVCYYYNATSPTPPQAGPYTQGASFPI